MPTPVTYRVEDGRTAIHYLPRTRVVTERGFDASVVCISPDSHALKFHRLYLNTTPMGPADLRALAETLLERARISDPNYQDVGRRLE